MNTSSSIIRATAGTALLAALLTGCGQDSTESVPAEVPAPAAGAIGLVTPSEARHAPRVTPTGCAMTADQVDRAIAAGNLPACARAKQREARREYRRLTRVHRFGHQ